MATVCNIVNIKNSAKSFVENYIHSGVTDHSAENILGAMSEAYPQYSDNPMMIRTVEKMLKEMGVIVHLQESFDGTPQLCPFLKKYQIDESTDILEVFKTNLDAQTYMLKTFAKEALEHCVLDTSIYSINKHWILTNKALQSNIIDWKNSLMTRLLEALSNLDDLTGIDSILKLANVDTIEDVVVFDEAAGADEDLYTTIMEVAHNNFKDINLELFDFVDPENEYLSELIYSTLSLINFDSLLSDQMKNIISDNKREKGNLLRTNYELIGAAEGSQQDLMGISDYDYENALNYISASLEKIISSVPLVAVYLPARRNEKTSVDNSINGTKYPHGIIRMNNLGTTISISHILQATAWLLSQLPRLGEYLNFGQIEVLHNPQEISFQILKTIHDFITQEWNSTETTSERLLGVDVSISRDETKKIIKSAGSSLNTLMSLYEFLFNNDDRANKETLSIVGIQQEQGDYAPKFNIIADITGQMIATAAPALIEHNPDGTIWDSENESSPISTNYIQKALRNKSMFSFRSFLRSKFLMEVLSGNSEFAQILTTTTKERNTLAGCLTRTDFKNAVGSIFGIDPDHRQNSTSAINALRELLIGAELELLSLNKATLHTLFNRMGEKIIDLLTAWKNGQIPSFMDLYQMIGEELNNIINGYEIEIIGRALAPILSSAPTPTFHDRNGNQLGVYRTTSLVFMFPYMTDIYKRNIETLADVETKSELADHAYIPLRRRSNFLADHPEILENKNKLTATTPQYESTVAIPLTLGTEDNNLEARKQPEFVLDIRLFVGEYLSLINSTKSHAPTPMVGIQLGTYSDKTTLPLLVHNLLTKHGSKHMAEALFGDVSTSSAKMYPYQVTQKLDVLGHVLDTWRSVLQYLQTNINEIKDTWNLSDGDLTALLKVLSSADLKAFLNPNLGVSANILSKSDIKKWKDVVPVDQLLILLTTGNVKEQLSNPAYSILFEDATYPKTIAGNRDADTTDPLDNNHHRNFKEISKVIYDNAVGQVKLLEKILSIIPIKGGFNLRVLNRAAFHADVLLVEKFHYDTYDKTTYKLNQMLLDDVDIAVNKSAVTNIAGGVGQTILTILEKLNVPNLSSREYEKISKEIESLPHPILMAISALSKRYQIDGNNITFFEYLQKYFKDHSSTIRAMIGVNHRNNLGYKLFGKMFTNKGTASNPNWVLNPVGLIEVYTAYLQGTNFLRHQALDLSIKEAYEDKGADSNVALERYARELTTTKRNNTMTAPIRPFALGLVNGVNSGTVKQVMVENLPGGVFNTIGIDQTVDEYDGCGLISPYGARQESASLGKRKHTPVKKTFITPIHDYYAEELKWASNETTNQLIRESRGSEVDLYMIFRKMHNFKFDYDITKWWSKDNEGVIDIYTTLSGQHYYAREGFNYYRYDAIESLGNDKYIIYKTQVNKYGKPILDSEGNEIESSIEVNINKIIDIYDALNGRESMSLVNGKLEYSETIHDFIYELVTNVGEYRKGHEDKMDGPITQDDIYQPLRDSFIHIFSSETANKRGASNITPNTAWTDENVEWYWTEISLATGGEQLDAEHESNLSKITKGTQLLQDLAQKGYTSEDVTKVYQAIARAMKVSSDEFNEIEQAVANDLSVLPELIADKILKSLEIEGNNLELVRMISAFKERAKNSVPPKPFTLPLSLLTKEVIKSIAPELNHVIKQKDSGLMGVLNAASAFVQVYNINGLTYTFGSLLLDKLILHLKPYEARIQDFILKYNNEVEVYNSVDLNEDGTKRQKRKPLHIDDVLRMLSIVSIHSDLDAEIKAHPYNGVDNLHLLLYNLFAPQSYSSLTAIYSERMTSKFLTYEVIRATDLQPGDWFFGPGDTKPVKLESLAQLQQLILKQNNPIVYLCKHKPVDLQPQIRQINTETYSENEYTSFESVFSLHIEEAVEKQKLDAGIPADIPPVHDLITYVNDHAPIEDGENNVRKDYKLGTGYTPVAPIELGYLLEDMVNFKNHIKAFGFTLKQAPEKIVDANGRISYDWDGYYGGFNPKEDFEQLLLERIVQVYILEHFDLIKHSLTFATQVGQLSDERKEYIREKVLISDLAIVDFCSTNPWFVFGLLPKSKEALYKEYMSRPELLNVFLPIRSTTLRTALVIMPPIYRDLMGIGGKDISEIDINYFRKANSFYDIPSYLILEDRIDSDFIVRTFRGLYSIIVVDDLSNDEDLKKYGKDVLPLIRDGKRVMKVGQQVMYELPKSNYRIKRDKHGRETIIIKAGAQAYSDIARLLASDLTLVTVQPFLGNLSKTKDFSNLSELLKELQLYNTLPVLDPVYDEIYQMLEAGNIDPIELKKWYTDDVPQEYKKHYTPGILKKDYQEKYAQSMYHSFLRSLDMIATRIPTQNMSSIMPMKVASLTNSAVNNVFVTKWQQWLQGSDYDIDKAFLLGYNFDERGMFIRWSNQQKFYSNETFEASLRLPLPTGKILGTNDGYTLSVGMGPIDILATDLVLDFITLKTADKKDGNVILLLGAKYGLVLSGTLSNDSDTIELIILGLLTNRLEEVGGLYITKIEESAVQSFNLLVTKINSHNTYRPKVQGINNYSTFITHKVLNDPRNATTTYKSIDVATDAFSSPIKRIKWDLVPGNKDNGHLISLITASGAVGKDGVGIGANGTKVYFTTLNYQNRSMVEDPAFTIEDLVKLPSFNVTKLELEYLDKENNNEPKVWKGYIGPISDTRITPHYRKLYNTYIKNAFNDFSRDAKLYLYDRDAAQDVGALLSMAADNAKTLNLDKLHAETDYFAMHIYLAMIGVPPPVIISYFNSPAFKYVIDQAQNDLIKGHIPRITAESFEPKSDVSADMARQLKQLLMIFKYAKEISALASILSINQGIKVEEADIVSQKTKCELLYNDALEDRGIASDYFLLDTEYAASGQVSELATDKSRILINMKMEKANAKMKEVGITLKTPFDFNEFLNNPKYAEAIIAVYDVLKHNYNIFDIINKAPHFSQMLKSYNNVLTAYATVDKQLDFTMNVASKLYDSDIINPSSSGRELSILKKFNKKMINRAKGYYNDTILSKFIVEVLSKNAFVYTPNNGPKVQCDFMTDNSLHSFVDFVNGYVLPTLFQLFSNNKFLLGLEINEVEQLLTGMVFFGFAENLRSMTHKDFIGTSKFNRIQADFNTIKDIKISDLLKENGNLSLLNGAAANMTVGDLFYLYNTLMRIVSPRSNDLAPVFSSMNVAGTWKMQYQEYVSDIDSGLIPVVYDKNKFMAYLYKTGMDQIKFKLNVDDDMILHVKNDGKITYTRILLNMPYHMSDNNLVLDTERFILAILNGKIKVLDINLNCT